eukprot:Amastigsp_a514977_12.p2 type:complete len:242 gc:universal Amastigsp_a514977_12:750-25(-)
MDRGRSLALARLLLRRRVGHKSRRRLCKRTERRHLLQRHRHPHVRRRHRHPQSHARDKQLHVGQLGVARILDRRLRHFRPALFRHRPHLRRRVGHVLRRPARHRLAPRLAHLHPRPHRRPHPRHCLQVRQALALPRGLGPHQRAPVQGSRRIEDRAQPGLHALASRRRRRRRDGLPPPGNRVRNWRRHISNSQPRRHWFLLRLPARRAHPLRHLERVPGERQDPRPHHHLGKHHSARRGPH